jgi:hypothetical protein
MAVDWMHRGQQRWSCCRVTRVDSRTPGGRESVGDDCPYCAHGADSESGGLRRIGAPGDDALRRRANRE